MLYTSSVTDSKRPIVISQFQNCFDNRYRILSILDIIFLRKMRIRKLSKGFVSFAGDILDYQVGIEEKINEIISCGRRISNK